MTQINFDMTELQAAALWRAIRAAQDLYTTIATDTPIVNAAARRFDQALTCAIQLDAYEALVDPAGELAEQIKLVHLYETGYLAGFRLPAYIGDDETVWRTIGLFDCRETCELEVSDQAHQVWLVGFRAGQDVGADQEPV